MTRRIDGQLAEIEGIWRYEMPSLIHTPNDTGREWKIYAYRYFWNGDVSLARETGFIVTKSAPADLSVWSDEQWLFSANPYNPPAPLNKLVLLHLNVLHPSLQNIIAYADPAAFVERGRIYMTLSAYTAVGAPARIVLISSPDNGNSWQYLGDFMTAVDVAAMDIGYNQMSNAQIVRHDNELYLFATLGDDVYTGRGVFAFEITDLNRAQLARDNDGQISVSSEILLNTENLTNFGGGSATYHPDLKNGVLLSRATQSPDRPFQIGAFGQEIFD